MNFIEVISAGVLMGLGGSFHCIGMCGPLVIMLHGNPQNKSQISFQLIHHFGRTLSYLLISTFLFSLGKYVGFFGWQQGVSFLGGIIMIMGWIPWTQRKLGQWLLPLRRALPMAKIQSRWLRHFIWGVFNGTLPCGWVYSAVGASLLTGSWLFSLIFMLFFGLASAPSLIITALSGNKIWQKIPQNQMKWARASFAILGLLLLLRGANLGIPYISPKMEKQKMSCRETH